MPEEEPKRLSDLIYLVPTLKEIVAKIIPELYQKKSLMRLFETGRSLERQKWCFERGTTKTMNSKHLLVNEDTKVRAVDFVVFSSNTWSWDYDKFKGEYDLYGEIVKKNGLVWGGDPQYFPPNGWDKPHAQLPSSVPDTLPLPKTTQPEASGEVLAVNPAVVKDTD